MSTEKRDLKEVLELLKGVSFITCAVNKVVKDGVDVSDLSVLLELVKEHELLIAAFKDVKEIDDEVKDLDQAEIVELINAVFKMVKDIKEA